MRGYIEHGILTERSIGKAILAIMVVTTLALAIGGLCLL